MEANHIERGRSTLETYPCGFQIGGLPMAFSTLFLLLPENTFVYDAILGSHIFEISDLHIYGKQGKFELIFR
jgi:hypothetical protein